MKKKLVHGKIEYFDRKNGDLRIDGKDFILDDKEYIRYYRDQNLNSDDIFFVKKNKDVLSEIYDANDLNREKTIFKSINCYLTARFVYSFLFYIFTFSLSIGLTYTFLFIFNIPYISTFLLSLFIEPFFDYFLSIFTERESFLTALFFLSAIRTFFDYLKIKKGGYNIHKEIFFIRGFKFNFYNINKFISKK